MNIIKHPSVILIIGGRGKGKSALGHNLVERFHKERRIHVYMLILPQLRKKLKKLLPKWINLIEDIQKAPENCLILCDEAALKYHCHKWQKKETEIMDNIISISRQRKQTIIFITHITRKFSITLLDIDVLICKQPGLFHTLIERGGFKKLVEKAEEEFKKLPKGEVKKCNYIFSEDFKGFIRTGLCSYWSEELSEAFAGIPLEQNDNSIVAEEEEKPKTIRGGLKIWCKKKDKKKVLQILSKNSTIDGLLADESMFEVKNKAYINFDLTLKGDHYHLSSKRFDIEKSIKELETKKIPHIVDMETGKPVFAGGIEGGGFYPISQDDVEFKEMTEEIKVEEEKDELAEFAEKIKL